MATGTLNDRDAFNRYLEERYAGDMNGHTLEEALEHFTIDSVVSIVYFWIFVTWNYIFWQEANDEDLFNRFASACGGSLRKW